MRITVKAFQRLLLFFALFVLSLSIGCKKSDAGLSNEFPADLWVSSDAQDVHYYDLKKVGTKEVFYALKVCYPAPEIIKAIEKAMNGKGWTRLNEDFLNPGTKLSPSKGEWNTSQDEKARTVYTWMDDWSDRDGNIIRYSLTFISAKKENPSNMCDLSVLGLYIPQKVRQQMLKALPLGQ
jgi:hypothetical protein